MPSPAFGPLPMTMVSRAVAPGTACRAVRAGSPLPSAGAPARRPPNTAGSAGRGVYTIDDGSASLSRRDLGRLLLAGTVVTPRAVDAARADEDGGRPTGYRGFRESPAGVLFEDIREGEGSPVVEGDQVAVDWDAFAVHRGSLLQAKLLTKGGAFEGDEDNLLRYTLGDGTVISAIDEALLGMRKGGIRRIIVKPGPMYYPPSRPGALTQTFRKVGPKPSTFSGQRALDQLLSNPSTEIDKRIVMDIELLDVKPGGAARRGPGHMVERRGLTTDFQWESLGGQRQAGGLYTGP